MPEQKTTEHRVSILEEQVATHDKQLDKINDTLQRMSENQVEHREGQIRTQTMVEGMSRDIGDVKISVSKLTDHYAKLSDSQSRKWEQFFSKAFWALLGITASSVIYYLTGHVH